MFLCLIYSSPNATSNGIVNPRTHQHKSSLSYSLLTHMFLITSHAICILSSLHSYIFFPLKKPPRNPRYRVAFPSAARKSVEREDYPREEEEEEEDSETVGARVPMRDVRMTGGLKKKEDEEARGDEREKNIRGAEKRRTERKLRGGWATAIYRDARNFLVNAHVNRHVVYALRTRLRIPHRSKGAARCGAGRETMKNARAARYTTCASKLQLQRAGSISPISLPVSPLPSPLGLTYMRPPPFERGSARENSERDCSIILCVV